MTRHTLFSNTGHAIKNLSIAGLLCLPMVLNAQTLDYQGRVDFNVHLQSATSDWRYDNETRRTRIGRAGFGWSETLSPRFSGGLLLGYLDLSQADNPIDNGQITTGYYAGLQLNGKIIDTKFLSLKLDLSFIYNSTQKTREDQRVNNVWTQAEANLIARVPLGKRIGIQLGANTYNISGEQRNSGDISSINDFSETTRTGYSAGIDVAVDRSGSIGFDLFAGNREGGRIYFRRRF